MFENIINKMKFTTIYSVEHELKKAAIIRVFLGLVILVRYLEIFYSISIFEPGLFLTQSIVLFVIILFFIVGFITPISTLALIFAVNWFDSMASTETLGTSILTQVLIVLFLINHGLYGSIDSFIMQSKSSISKRLKKLYQIVGKPTKESIKKAYFIGFLFYALVSFAALSLHVFDPYWIQGLTLYSALTNSYLFKFYEISRQVELFNPSLLYIMSIIGIIMQSIFQFLMIPFMFFTIGRKFVVIWGLIFFTISLVGINLSYLPHIEILFWLLIFFSINPNKKKIIIIYDDHCGLCTRGMLFFKSLNFNAKYEFIALSKNKELYESKGVTYKEVQTYMVGWVDNQKYVGYDLYIEMFKANPLLWLFVPFLYIGTIGRVGSKLYNFIAERRYKFFGVCKLSSEDKIQKQLDLDFLYENKTFSKIAYSFISIILVVFIAIKYPIGIKENIDKNIVSKASAVLYKVGLQIPDVFNYIDLSMGDRWLVMHREVKKNDSKLVPIIALDGKRLNYENYDILNFSNHNSDFFYFGSTLRYRRLMINVSEVELDFFHTKGYGYDSIKKRLQYDYRKMNFTGTVKYKIKVYENSSSIVKKWGADQNRYISKVIYSAIFKYDGKQLKIVKTKVI